ncbi:MAG: ABC transporter permease [Herpetosiphonaceae bacterium]|nr:MAG: ABC transporter permease [Herpetosiphonaceae bacterium]
MAIAQPLDSAQELLTVEEESWGKIIWRRFRKHKMAIFGMVTLTLIFLFSYVGPLLRPYPESCRVIGQSKRDCVIDAVVNVYAPRSAEHPLGLDDVGRDTLTRLMYGGRISLFVGLSCAILSTIIGIVIGAVSGFYGRWVDAMSMRFVEFMLTLPTLPILLIIAAIRAKGGANFINVLIPTPIASAAGSILSMKPEEARDVLGLVLILVVFGWMGTALLVRGTVLSLRTLEYADAARALGASSWRIIRRHMIPNSLAPIIVSVTLAVGDFIIIESALSFLGFGVRVPTPTWGNMLTNTQAYMFVNPWLALYPGLLIFLTVLSINYIGDALRDALDPRLKE